MMIANLRSAMVWLAVFASITAYAEDAALSRERLELKDVKMYLAITDLKRTLTTLEKIAAAHLPAEQYKPGTIVAALDDPLMKSFGSKPFVAAGFKGEERLAAIYVPFTDADQINEASKADFKAVLVEDNILAVAKTEKDLERARAAKEDYKKIAASMQSCDARFWIGLEGMAPHERPKFIRDVPDDLQRMAQALDNPEAKQRAGGELLLALIHLVASAADGFLQQSRFVQLELKLSPEAVDFDLSYAAKEDSVIGAFLSGTPPAPDPKLAGLLSNGTVTSRFCYDPAALVAALKRVEAELKANPKLKPFVESELIAGLIDEAESRGGETLTGSSTPFGESEVSVHTVSDGKKYLAACAKKLKLLARDSELNKFYGIAGASFKGSFLKSGTHNGVDIYHELVNFDFGRVAPKLKMLYEAAGSPPLSDYYVAIRKGICVTSDDEEEIPELLNAIDSGKRVEKPLVLKSEQKFGRGKQFYWEMDLIGDDEGADKGAKGKPIMMALAYNGGRAKAQFHAEFTSIAAFAAPLLELFKIAGNTQRETKDEKF